jgi:hypothetical protein
MGWKNVMVRLQFMTEKTYLMDWTTESDDDRTSKCNQTEAMLHHTAHKHRSMWIFQAMLLLFMADIKE